MAVRDRVGKSQQNPQAQSTVPSAGPSHVQRQAQVSSSPVGGLSTQDRTALAGIMEEQLACAPPSDDDGFTIVTHKKHHSPK